MVTIVLFSGFTFNKQNEKIGVNELSKIISTSFKIGNSDLLATCLDKEIELIIDGDRIEFQKLPSHQAENILKSFFKKNPPLSFRYVYQGNNNSELKYCIGNYKSKNRDYMVYMLIKKDKNDRFVLNALQLKMG